MTKYSWLNPFSRKNLTPAPMQSLRDGLSSNAITLKVYPAVGGCVIEVSMYNNKLDEYRNYLHMVRETEDLANAIGGIIITAQLSN